MEHIKRIIDLLGIPEQIPSFNQVLRLGLRLKGMQAWSVSVHKVWVATVSLPRPFGSTNDEKRLRISVITGSSCCIWTSFTHKNHMERYRRSWRWRTSIIWWGIRRRWPGDDPADSGVGLSSYAPTIAERRGKSLTYDEYKIGIIYALPKELAAIKASSDEHHQCLPQLKKDTNSYCLGSIGTRNVVAACLLYEEYDISIVAKAASDMDKTFTTLERIFLVGIGGGFPSKEHGIRLGNVVVGTGIIQHGMGKTMQKDSRLLRTGFTQRPDTSLNRNQQGWISSQSQHWFLRNTYLTHISLTTRIRKAPRRPRQTIWRRFLSWRRTKYMSKLPRAWSHQGIPDAKATRSLRYNRLRKSSCKGHEFKRQYWDWNESDMHWGGGHWRHDNWTLLGYPRNMLLCRFAQEWRLA